MRTNKPSEYEIAKALDTPAGRDALKEVMLKDLDNFKISDMDSQRAWENNREYFSNNPEKITSLIDAMMLTRPINREKATRRFKEYFNLE